MGEVWRAYDTRLDREVAIKRIASQVAQHDAYAVRMQREAKALARIRHATLVTVYDIQQDANGLPFIVMELLHGETLADWVDRHPAAGGDAAVSLLLPVLDGLEAAHRAGVVHRDLKPDNIFLVREGDRLLPKLIDFGIASIEELGSNLTVGPIGTPTFMAPEQITLGDPIGPYTDVWALCTCIYAAAVGEAPFHRADVAETFRAVRELPLPFPRNGCLDGPLFSIVARGTRKRPGERFASIAELRDALVEWQRNTPNRAPHRAVAPALPSSSIPPRVTPVPDEVSTELDNAIRSTLGRNK